jgi:hypothetical protein
MRAEVVSPIGGLQMLVNAQSSRDRSRQTFAPWSRFQPLRVLHKVAINLGRRLNSISPQPPTALSDRLHSSDCAIDTLVNALKSATILCQVIPQLYSYASLASPYQFLWAFSASAFYLSGPLHVAALRQRFSNKRAYSKSKLLIRSIPQPCLLHYDPFSYLGPPVRKKILCSSARTVFFISFCCDVLSSVIRRLASAFLACGKGKFGIHHDMYSNVELP